MREIRRHATTSRRSSAVVYNGMAFIGGQTAEDRTLDIRGQTRQVLAKIDRLLAEAGTSKSRLLSVQIWLKDITHDFAGMNEIWDTWTAPGNAPTRATVQCALGLPEILIEVIVTAAVDEAEVE
ncbi:RidA family protein [Variovorax sp. J22P271]|uniref:RidA family protein n=1 Tax=Variovorax davisae TaxID=3053515 RepID=UPI002577F6F6|nr:RidA family protein [Variovorax sp. J22P271]MDM0032449.1 RidA family protein [Variovorax sp. J22P271]